MTKFLTGFLVAAVLALGVFALLSKHSDNAGGILNYKYNPTVVSNQPLQYTTISGNMSNSSTTPTTSLASLASIGHLTVGTGQTTQSASTTAVTANSIVDVKQELTTPIAGTTCNTNVVASSSAAVSVYSSSTNTSLNGFKITVNAAPVTNPFCYSYRISN